MEVQGEQRGRPWQLVGNLLEDSRSTGTKTQLALNDLSTGFSTMQLTNMGQPSSAPPPAAGDRPSGHNKKEVHLAIAKCIFEDNSLYSEQYAANPDKFQLCVMNCLIILKEKYHEHAKSLKQTGGGVAPRTENNLREAITKMFPYFDDLDLIWKGNPSFNARPFTSNQQKNCVKEMLALVWGGATCPGDNPPVANGKNSEEFMAADGYGGNKDFGVEHEVYYGEDQGDQEDQEGLGFKHGRLLLLDPAG
ncbi:hypothetical protein EV401DRAFT_1886261 [Pisolithus croceorrhizus]|nr:hypothetical protein EV401DRAFT_1886261 [Pisolithus croceorrhizus]